MKDRKVVLIALLVFGMLVGISSGQNYLVRINFEQEGATTPDGYIKDYGKAFSSQNGFEYGFDVDIFETRNRNSGNSLDERYDSLNHLQKQEGHSWEIAVPNGVYDIFLVCGDPSNTDQVNTMDVEGVILTDPDGGDNFDEYTIEMLEVTDGRITIKPAAGSSNSKLSFIDIINADPTYNPPPSVGAGIDQEGYVADTYQLSGAVSDNGSADGTSSIGGVASFVWAQESGPGTAAFSGTDILDPTVTFDAAGEYELFLTATDLDAVDANDAVTILVLEPQLVRHWSMDIDPNDDGGGVLVGGAFIDTSDAAVGTGSVNLMGLSPTDPNMPRIEIGKATDLDFGLTNWTVAGWVKTTQTGTGNERKGAMFANGGDGSGGHRYTLIVGEGPEGNVDLVADDNSNKNTARTDGKVNDDVWHFVVGLREGDEIRIYRDGLLEDTEGVPDVYTLAGTSQHDSYIGVITNNGNSNLEKHLYGSVDDVRVYNYAISQEQIEGLAGMGELPPAVSAGGDITVQLKPGEKVTLAGIAADYGIAGPLSSLWTTESDLSVADAVFTDATSAVTEVEFPVFGIYVLTLTAEDATNTVSDSITIEVVSPTCADVISEGLLLVGDISGPDGTPDCRVNLIDVAQIAAAWMTCNDPSDVNCAFPY